MATPDVLTLWGIQRGADAADLAAQVGLALPIAATLLEKESGGRNVWGSDGVQTGGAYVKGGPVTRDNYLTYRALVQAGRIGRQGVGPGQLTYGGYQDEADRRGGCWDWAINCRYSFEILRDLQRQYGVARGFVAYNGGARAAETVGLIPAAERYGADAMAKLARWTDRIGTPTPSPNPRPTPAPARPQLTHGMRAHPEVRKVQQFMARVFPGYAAGLPPTGNYYDETARVIREFQRRTGVTGPDADGRTIGPRTWTQLTAHGYR